MIKKINIKYILNHTLQLYILSINYNENINYDR